MKPAVFLPIALVLVLGAFLIGRWSGGHPSRPTAAAPEAGPANEVQFWTCSMHPQIKQPDPGQCPICAMDLVPVYETARQTTGPRSIELSPEAIALADISTTPVIRHQPTAEVRMVGKLDYDETRLSYITARVPGRLDRLYVDYTGITVNKGDHLVWLYSPELLAAQEELLQAIQTAEDLQQSSDRFLRERAAQTVQAARDKLLLWGLAEPQVQEIVERNSSSDHLTINAPVGGIVIHKNAVEGMYVNEGTQIYTIADLSELWLRLDAYESDLQWLHFGQDVQFTTEAYPGEQFTGWISFIDPVLNSKTRTVKVRVNVDNTSGRLKPGMFVRAVVHSRIAAGGKVMTPDLAGKWIGPMHPEVVRDEPGPCPVCGMPLVPAESLGYQSTDLVEAPEPLVIPDTAPLITGKRAVVYVASADQPGVFEGRTIRLGPRAGGFYIVESGLSEGEQVVSHGAFKVDSAVQILAKPSMMNPEERPADAGAEQDLEPPPSYDAPPAFREQLRTTVNAYFPVADSLSHDNLDAARTALPGLNAALEGVSMSILEGEAHQAWMNQLKQIQAGLDGLEAAGDIDRARTAFERLSSGLIQAAETFGLDTGSPVYVYHCPMAMNGEGADWIQNKQGTENPYYGSAMFSCGSETKMIGGQEAENDGPGESRTQPQ